MKIEKLLFDLKIRIRNCFVFVFFLKMKSINLTLILLLCILQCRPTHSQIFFKPTTILSSSLTFRGILKNIGLRGAIFADLTDIWNFVSDKFNLGLELNQRRQAHNEIIQKLVNVSYFSI